MDEVEVQRLTRDLLAPETLAGKEFGKTWVPIQRVDKTAELASMTIGASDRIRAMEKTIKEAKKQEEREAIRRDADIFRLNLTYTGEEGLIVKQALGDRPACKFLEMCKREVAS